MKRRTAMQYDHVTITRHTRSKVRRIYQLVKGSEKDFWERYYPEALEDYFVDRRKPAHFGKPHL